MLKTLITLLAVSVSLSAFAPPDLPAPKLRAPTEVEPTAPVVKTSVAKEPFAAGEWVVELGANYLVPQPNGIGDVLKTDPKHGDFGVSIGVTKFFTRNLGVGIEAGVNDVNETEDVDHASLFIIARTPLVDILPTLELVKNIAPYAIVGAGHDFHSGKQHGFFESRFVFAEQDSGGALVTRLGVRFALW